MNLDYDAQCYCSECLPSGNCWCDDCYDYPDSLFDRLLYHPAVGYVIAFAGGVAFVLAVLDA